jgi:hypothetical protein
MRWTSMDTRTSYVGLFLVFGAAVGSLIFILTQQAMHIAAGSGIGIVVGAIADSISAGRERKK